LAHGAASGCRRRARRNRQAACRRRRNRDLARRCRARGRRRLGDPGARGRIDLAVRRAAERAGGEPEIRAVLSFDDQIALFDAGVDESVAAYVELARARATVLVDEVAVVALLAPIDDAVAAVIEAGTVVVAAATGDADRESDAEDRIECERASAHE